MGERRILSLGARGAIEGVSITSNTSGDTLCHYFGGIRYALPPSKRWQHAKALPSGYHQYGTEERPFRCPAGTRLCPQLGAFVPIDMSAVDEDCFQLNVWVPAGQAPDSGWPVFVFFHGGFLQFGSPNEFNMAGLLHETDFKAIIVVPAYRLNIFGFLYSAELEKDSDSDSGKNAGNYGLWDQRLALEWVRDNIHFFGGNSRNITAAGYSAGAYSAFYQLAYDLWQPSDKAIIKRAVMWSNGPGFQPKSPKDAQIQFNQVLSVLGIPTSLPGPEKLALLRALPPEKLLEGLSSPRLSIHQFRPVTDSAFVSPSLFDSLKSGEFAARLRQRNTRIMLGEVSNEHAVYNLWRPPQDDSLNALRQRLEADYSPSIVNALIQSYFRDGKLPSTYANWNHDAFGHVYADMQIHIPQRGLIHSIVQGSASDLLYRYKIEFRAKAVDQVLPVEFGTTHTTDQFLWFWGNRLGLEEWEKKAVCEALVEPLAKFVRGQEDDMDWGTESYRQVRTFTRDGRVEIQPDTLWDSAIETWKALQEAMESQSKL